MWCIALRGATGLRRSGSVSPTHSNAGVLFVAEIRPFYGGWRELDHCGAAPELIACSWRCIESDILTAPASISQERRRSPKLTSCECGTPGEPGAAAARGHEKPLSPRLAFYPRSASCIASRNRSSSCSLMSRFVLSVVVRRSPISAGRAAPPTISPTLRRNQIVASLVALVSTVIAPPPNCQRPFPQISPT